MLNLFRPKAKPPSDAERVYARIVEQARDPWFYAEAGAPDTAEGRFDMIALHAFLVFRRLRREGPAIKGASQAIFDAMFKDLDAALREIGVGDLSVGKKIRGLAEAFYGRAEAYEAPLAAGDEAALARAVGRNVHGVGGGEPPFGATRIAAYAIALDRTLAERSAEAILDARIDFPAPGSIGSSAA